MRRGARREAINKRCKGLGGPKPERKLLAAAPEVRLGTRDRCTGGEVAAPETMDGQPVYDNASDGEETSLLPQQQRRGRRLRPAVGAAVACVAAFGAVAVVTNARATELRRVNAPEMASSFGSSARAISSSSTPTIVISLLDDQGYADVPWHAQDAATQAAMPFADMLRKDAGGIDVKNYHAWRDCTSRAMPLTGGTMPSWACTCRCWAARRPRSRPTRS